MKPEILLNIVEVVIYYSLAGLVAFFGLKYGLRETVTKVNQHIDDDRKAFKQVSETHKEIAEKLDTTIGLLNAHSITLSSHGARADSIEQRQERIEGKVDSIDEKLTDLRVAVAARAR